MRKYNFNNNSKPPAAFGSPTNANVRLEGMTKIDACGECGSRPIGCTKRCSRSLTVTSLVASRQAILHQIVTVNWAGICMQSLHYIIYAMLQSGWPNGPPSLQPQAYFHFVSVCIAAGVLVTCCLIHVIVTITNVSTMFQVPQLSCNF